MTDQGNLLLEIQRIDLAAIRMERELAEMPEKRAILTARKRIKDITSLGERTDSFIAEIERAIARLEDEVATLSAKMESEQAKLMSGKVTNPKEAQHISNELDALKRRKEKIEDDVLVQMEKRERALEQHTKITAAMEEARSKEAGLIEGFKGKGGNLQQELGDLARARGDVLAQLDADNRERYTAHCEDRAGIVVGALRGNTCGACRMELPTETVRELNAGPDIAECPLCGRILLVRVEETD